MSFSSRLYVLVTLFYLTVPCIHAEIIISPATPPSTPPTETIIAAPEQPTTDGKADTSLPTKFIDAGIKISLKKLGFIATGIVAVGYCLYAAYQHIQESFAKEKITSRQSSMYVHEAAEVPAEQAEQEVILDLSDEQRELVRSFALAVEAMDAQAIEAFNFDTFPVDIAVLLQWVQMNVITLCADAHNLDSAKQYCGQMVVALRGIADPDSFDFTTLVEA